MAEQEIPPSREEWAEWKLHPVSKWFYQEILKEAEAVQDGLATGSALQPTAESTAMTYARQFGISEGLCKIISTEPPIVEALR